MFLVAQTNVQLFNQVRALGWRPSDLDAINRAYELSVQLYAGYFQADGKPFVCHAVGVASILAHLGLPPSMVAAALVHNVYGNGDFGDGRLRRASRSRRQLVRTVLGVEIETLVWRFSDYRITAATIERFCRSVHELDATARALLVMDLADQLEKVADLGAVYMADQDWATALLLQHTDQMVALARDLDQPLLAAALAESVAQLASEAKAEGRPHPGDRRRYLKLIVPKSCRRRLYPRLVRKVLSLARALHLHRD